MHPEQVRSPKLAFGPFEFDTATGELHKNGHKLKLASQPSLILKALLDRPGELMSRDELRSLLWPRATAGDFDHGLNAAINRLRQALCDSADRPLYVETLPARGYRFVAPVRPLGRAVLELVPSPAALAPLETTTHSRHLAWVGAATALLALLAAVFWVALHLSPRKTGLRPARSLITPPEGYFFEGGGLNQAFALSPDGNRIAFIAKGGDGSFRLFLRDLAELDNHGVADGEGAYSVVWGPDGKTLLFTAGGKLRRVAVNAAASEVLSDAIPYFCAAIPFGPDRLLVTNTFNSGVMPSNGGRPHPIERLYAWAQLMPGGREFLYTTYDPRLGSSRARIAPVGGDEQGTDLVQADSRVQFTGSLHSDGGYLMYLRGGTLLAQPFDPTRRKVTAAPRAVVPRVPSFGSDSADFSVSGRGVLAYQTYVSRSQFIWVDRTGKRLSAASPGDMNATFVRLSPDGRRLAAVPFDIEQSSTAIWLFDALSGAGRKAIFGPGIRHHPVWSPDAKRLVHVIGNHSWPRLGVSSLDGTPDSEPLPDTGFMIPTDWSSDGRFILYNNSALPAITNDFPSDVFAIDMARNRKVIPLLSTRFYESGAVLSPDGKWLAFLSNESGQAEIYLQALDYGDDSLRVTGERFLVSRHGAQCLRWRKNGRELYYLARDGRVYAVPLTFEATSVRIYRPEPLFTIDAEARATIHSVDSFDVSPDGNRFVIPSMLPGERSALVVLQDWESLLLK